MSILCAENAHHV